VSLCHITFVSMSCHICLHVMSHLSPCHVTCVSMSYNICLHVMSHVSMSYFSVSCHMCLYVMLHVSLSDYMCLHVMSHVFPCHVACLSMSCYMCLHIVSYVSPCHVACVSMSYYVYPCHVTWERYSIQILANAINNSFLPYQNITKTNIWRITDFFFNITNKNGHFCPIYPGIFEIYIFFSKTNSSINCGIFDLLF
jgi:hypothetical protein